MRFDFVQNIIDLLRGKIYALQTFCNAYNETQIKNNADTLILGTSHLLTGYVPNESEMQLAITSEDLYYSLKLYEKFNNEQFKNVIISYSMFSRGYSQIYTRAASLCCLFKLFFDIPYQYEEIAKTKHLHFIEKLYKNKVKKALKYGDQYHKSKIFKCNHAENGLEVIRKRATKHYKHSLREVSQLDYLIKLAEKCNQNNQNLFIIIPPATSCYKECIPNSKELVNEITQLMQNYPNTKIIDFYHTDLFKTDDFHDGDHLNNKGAIKMTDLIRNREGV